MPAHLYSFTVCLREQKKSFIFHLMCTVCQPCRLGAHLRGKSGKFSAVLWAHCLVVDLTFNLTDYSWSFWEVGEWRLTGTSWG